MLILSNISTLYDGSGANPESVSNGVDLVLEDGVVRELRPHRPGVEPPAGDGLTRIDCSGKTVTPGLIDCHGHVTALGLSAADMDILGAPEELVYVEKILHTTLVDGGVTTMRDVGGATHKMKRLVDQGVMIGPRLKVAICMLSTTGGHADMRGPDRCHAEISKLWKAGPGRPSSIVDGPWECRKRVREIAGSGADLIKLCTSPGIASPSDALGHRDFTAEEIAAICDEAASRGLTVAAHAHSASGIDFAIAHGVHDIQHISFMGERQVEAADARGVVVTPTSWVLDELTRADGLSPFVMDKVKQAAEVHRAAVAYAAAGGLPILMGTDPVLPGMHGRNYMELIHMCRDGLDPRLAWFGATGLAAREIDQGDAGVLAAGRRADLLVWNEDVIAEPERMAAEGALVEVVKDGVGYRGALPGIPQRTYRSAVRGALWPGRDL